MKIDADSEVTTLGICARLNKGIAQPPSPPSITAACEILRAARTSTVDAKILITRVYGNLQDVVEPQVQVLGSIDRQTGLKLDVGCVIRETHVTVSPSEAAAAQTAVIVEQRFSTQTAGRVARIARTQTVAQVLNEVARRTWNQQTKSFWCKEPGQNWPHVHRRARCVKRRKRFSDPPENPGSQMQVCVPSPLTSQRELVWLHTSSEHGSICF